MGHLHADPACSEGVSQGPPVARACLEEGTASVRL